MKKLLLILTFFLPLSAMAQSVDFSEDDNRQRGYYTRPYLRYEAEAGECVQKCVTNGVILPPTYNQNAVQSEASNQTAVQLVEQGDFVQWTNEQAADGLTIRFSLPDSEQGTGMQGIVALYVNDNFVQNIMLDSYWAWQYFTKTSTNHADNTPNATTKFPRMRFDEVHILLANKIPANAEFQLVKVDNNSTPYTIDFVELENVPAPVLFSDITDDNKIAYNPEIDNNISTFINTNRGKTIYLPEGEYDISWALDIATPGTKIIGAGMWRTTIFFSASSDQYSTYSQRGFKFNAANLTLEGLSLNTINNKRYYNNNTSYQVGKGVFAGSACKNSIVRNVRSEHFECGAWIDGADNLLVQNCRFTNNYADGINLSYGTKNSIVEYCSFRNNGDDDMATWSRSNRECSNNIFRYCTAEHNWRASSLGFFGGKQNQAYNIVIRDGLEAGFRVTCDFSGSPFSADGYCQIHDISVYQSGSAAGSKGTTGDLWGSRCGAIHLNSANNYDLKNFYIYNIDLYNSKDNAIIINSGNKSYSEVYLRDINVFGAKSNGIYFSSAKGNIKHCGLTFQNVVNQNIQAPPASLTWEQENISCQVTDLGDEAVSAPSAFNLLAPANAATLENADVTFSWQPSTDSESIAGYELYVNGSLKVTTTETSATVNLPDANYNWYVKAINCNGATTQSTSTFSFVLNAVLAVFSPKDNSGLIIFPNPATSEIRIMNEEPRDAVVQILDITGKIIFDAYYSLLDDAKINVSALSSGIYFLKIDNKIAKFIKK
ncbi:MAG: T9SS type A sorting domain-containing protein [Prevotellaceae bacterium]|jgi:hypothetical protein|nr:T9SS type A sorting domain-containing protein [Prevotellaceae bacterium]